MSLIIDSSSINRAKRMLIGVPKGADKAIANAINKSARTAVTGVIKGIRKKYVIKSSKARKYGTFIKRAKPGNLSAIINIKGKVVPLGYFDIKPNTPKRVVPFARVKKVAVGTLMKVLCKQCLQLVIQVFLKDISIKHLKHHGQNHDLKKEEKA